MNFFIKELLIWVLELVGAFAGWMSINYFKDKRYFWGCTFAIITIRVIAGVIKTVFV